MAASYGAGGQSPPVKGRPVDRVFEDAQFTGEVNLSGRKLKDYPKICTKYDLGDTIHTDLSKNRFSEAPTEVCDYCNMERLNCYHNIIKSIPEAIIQLQSLTHLNLSRNQLAVLPVSLCTLSSLEVLLASNNKLVSLPEEIGKLERLMDLDVSCNEISHLPPQIGDLRSLRSLNLRRNLLVELPLDICKLSLRRLDISSNRIEKIPTVFRKLEVLEDIILEHNPLSSPPAHICTRGRQHIMKYLHTEAVKEDRKRGILTDSDMKRLIRKSLPPQHPHSGRNQRTSDEFRNILEAPEAKWKRHTVLSSDSGYSTADSLDKCGWNQAEGAVGEVDHNSVLAIKAAAEAVWEQRQSHMNSTNAHIPSDIARARLHPTPASPSLSNRSVSPLMSPNNCNNNTPHSNSGGTPSPQASSASGDFSQVYNTRTIHSPLPQRHSNHHHHHLNHQPFHQRQNFYNQLQSQSLQQQSHYHSHAPPPLSVVLPPSLHGQLSLNDLQSFHQTNQFYKGSNEEFPPPPAPLALVEEEELTPPVTPPTPLAQQVMSVTGSLEDEFTRIFPELQRQKQEYEQRKKAAEQIRLAQEDKEREERRKAALKVQEEQKALLDRQREEQQRKEVERRQQEEQLKMQEQQRLLEEQAKQEEEARLRETEETRAHEEERLKEEARQQEEARKNKATNNAIYEQPTAPPQGLRLHDNYSDYTNVYSHRYGDDFVSYSGLANTSPQSDYILSEWEYRNALSSQSLKEQRRIVNNQYRRTVSDTTPKRSIPTAININSHIDDGQNHITRNGVAEEDTNISPTHSSKPTSPTTTNPNLSRQQAGGDRAAPAQNSGGRRSKGAERSNVPTPTSGRSVSRTSSTSSVNSVHSQSSSGKTAAGTTSTVSASATARGKNHLTPTSTPKNVRKAVGRIEEEFRQKHQQVKTQHQAESQRLKSRLEEQRSKGSASSASTKKPGVSDTDNKRQAAGTKAGSTAASRNTRTGLSAGAMKMLEEYKDANPNFTIRRRDDQQREENQQLEALRQTIESRLKVTLPDNLPEALRDGVVLCHLANQIRPRSVASIHVPSPAVPKLTSAKCRRNVENFLDACRKIGVDQEQICMAADIMDERGVHRVAITVAALVAVGTNPRQSAV